MSSSEDPGNWKDEDTKSESWGQDHTTALVILGACIVGLAVLIVVGLLIFSCVADRKKNTHRDEEQQQQQEDPFATAQFSAKNAAFETSYNQELAAPMPMGKSVGGADAYGGYGTPDAMSGADSQYAAPVGKWVGGADPYAAGYGSQGAMQGGYAQPYVAPQYAYQWYQQPQQAASPGNMYDTEQTAMGWPQQPYEAPPVRTTGAWS